MVKDVQFPRSEDFFFKPLNEHVPVYQKAFRLVQNLAIDASPQGVTGAHRRRAPDDQGHVGLPGLRRQGVLHAAIGAVVMDR